MGDILSHLASGCVVVDRKLNVLHANQAALAYFHTPEHQRDGLEFSDLPQALGGKIYEALNTGAFVPPFKYRPPNAPERACQVTITPFETGRSRATNAVLLLIEDVTDHERSQQLEIETANLRLIRSMAERMAHEIGNSLVPISTYHQMGKERFEDPEFRAAIDGPVTEGVRRISRLSRQMLFLARDDLPQTEPVPVPKLIEEAFHEAQTHLARKTCRLEVESESGALGAVVRGDAVGLIHALAEVLLNALQANPQEALAKVRWRIDAGESDQPRLRIDVRDAGEGFSPEAALHAAEAFFSTRVVGLGLGLTVARRIIEMHHGRLEIVSSQPTEPGAVRILLPVTIEEHAAAPNGAR
jgi:polar amino acid transport system substrate-binding protein